MQVVFNSGEETLAQPVHVITPGEPDPPEIVLKSVDSMKFEISWQEPRTYGNEKISAYEVRNQFYKFKDYHVFVISFLFG